MNTGDPQQILVALLDEGTDVWRPVEAVFLGNDAYRIVSPQPDPQDERWEYVTGDIVKCEKKHFSQGSVGIVAVALLSPANASARAIVEGDCTTIPDQPLRISVSSSHLPSARSVSFQLQKALSRIAAWFRGRRAVS